MHYSLTVASSITKHSQPVSSLCSLSFAAFHQPWPENPWESRPVWVWFPAGNSPCLLSDPPNIFMYLLYSRWTPPSPPLPWPLCCAPIVSPPSALLGARPPPLLPPLLRVIRIEKENPVPRGYSRHWMNNGRWSRGKKRKDNWLLNGLDVLILLLWYHVGSQLDVIHSFIHSFIHSILSFSVYLYSYSEWYALCTLSQQLSRIKLNDSILCIIYHSIHRKSEFSV